MAKRRIIVLAIVTLMLLTPVLAAAASITWKDKNLEDAVRDALVLNEETPVSEQDMRLLKVLNAWGWDEPDEDEVIRNLHGLQFATNLKKADLSSNYIADLTPIADLNLEYLDIQENNDAAYKNEGKVGFAYNPSNPQMVILNDLQNRGAVVLHDGPVKRISGDDRYNTAIRIWQNWTYEDSYIDDDHKFEIGENLVDGIFLARGDDYADALAGVPLAYDRGMPILLTQSNSLNADLKKQITAYVKESKVDYFEINVLGGEAAVSSAVVNEIIYHLETEFAGLDVKQYRFGGADRFATSVAIAKELIGNPGTSEDDVNVIFTSGRNFPDALAAAPYAAMAGAPILLVEPDSIPAVVKTYLTTTEKKGIGRAAGLALVAGGPAAVSEKVVSDLYALRYRDEGKDNKVFVDTDKDIIRAWGADRYETAVAVVKYFEEELELDVDSYYLATGENFADALTGAWLAAAHDTGILLVKPNAVPTKVKDQIEDAEIDVFILGGETAVTRHNAVLLYNLVR